jgi:hypothetical protein
MDGFHEALHKLLGEPDEELIQTVYVRLTNGKTLVFVGAPITDEEADQIEDIVFAEQIPACLIGLTSQASRTTVQ